MKGMVLETGRAPQERFSSQKRWMGLVRSCSNKCFKREDMDDMILINVTPKEFGDISELGPDVWQDPGEVHLGFLVEEFPINSK